MKTKQKVVLAQHEDEYKVIKLVNRIKPDVGTKLKRKEVQSLLMEHNTTVEIHPQK